MRKGSIFFRLLIAFAVIGVASAAPLIYLSVDFTRSSTERRAEENAAQQMQIIGANFDQEISANLRRSLQFIVSSEVISLFLSVSRFEQLIVGEQVETLLLRISEQQEEYTGIYYFDHEGVPRVGAEDGKRNALAPAFLANESQKGAKSSPGMALMREIFKEMKKTPLLLASGNMEWFMPPQEARLSEPFMDDKGRLSLIAALPVVDFDDGSFGGVVFIRQRLDLFAQRLTSVRFFDSNPVWLFDRNGNALLQPSAQEASFDPRKFMAADFSPEVRVEKVEEGLLVYRDLAIAPGERAFRIAFAIPSALLMKDFIPTIRFFLLALTASMVLVGVFALLVSRSVSRPIVKLAEAASRLAGGDMSARVEASGVGEVKILVDSFNKMSANLQIADANRSRAEQRLIDAMHQARKASAAKTDFLATMSHEIRTPMNGVLGTLNLLRGTELDARQRRYIHNINDSANTLLIILNDILDISKIEAGAVALENTDFLLRPMIDATADLMRARAVEKGLAFTLEAPPDLPEAVRGDPVRLRQILANFISNAVKFTAQGEVGVFIACETLASGALRLTFRIKDTGCGVAKEDLEEIFDKFSQADTSTTRRYGGTGLGLSISSQLVTMMKGEVGVSSALGEGSEFHFSVVVAPGDPEKAINPSADDGADIAIATQPLYVLVAEDQPINQEIARDTLERAGHRVKLVSNGRAAVEAVSRDKFDVVLMDVHMPEMDGPAATRAIRKMKGPKSAIPIIALTADAMVGAREAILASGMNGYVSKPFKPEELFGAMRLHTSGAKDEKANAQRQSAAPAPEADEVEEPDAPLMDPAIIDPLRTEKPKLWRRIVGLFLETTPETLSDIDHAVVQGDARAARAGAHSLKSASGNIGAAALADLARAFEEAAASDDKEAMARLFPLLSCVHARTLALLRDEARAASAQAESREKSAS